MLLALGTASTWFLAASAQAQIGSGWTQTNFTERLEYESNDVLITISPPPSSFDNGDCEYDNTDGIETFQLLNSHSNRAEIRANDDYSSGSRQFEADVLVSEPSADECIHQIFNGTVSPYLLLREETNDNGSLKVALNAGGGASNLGSNLYGTWFHLNTINSLVNGYTYVYLNGTLIWSGANPGGTFYTKYGCYGTLAAASAKIQFKNVKFYYGGDTNEATVASPTLSPGGGTYTSAQSVTISTTTDDASIRYTTDGSTPSETNGTLYSSPVNISSTTTLKAIAFETGFFDSGIAMATYTINSLPAGWTDTDIGAVGQPGSASYSSGVFTVSGSGTDIWGIGDQFNYAYESATNDFTLTARVVSQNGADSWAKSGVMIRGDTTTNSPYAALYVTPGQGVSMQCRTASGASAVDLDIQSNNAAPYWVSLTRSGNYFAAYSSPDGVNWTLLASTNITMNANVLAGLCVCAHDNTSLDTATIDNVSVAAPSQFAIPFSAVSASSTYESYWPSNTVDGNLNTRWTSSGTNQWIQYDLGSTQLVSLVDLAFYDGNSRLYYFNVLMGNSTNGPWTTVLANLTNSGTTTNLETYDFAATYGRYVRVLCNTGNHDNYNNITETQVWGY